MPSDIVLKLQSTNQLLMIEKEKLELTIQELRQKLIELQQRLRISGVTSQKLDEAFQKAGLDGIISAGTLIYKLRYMSNQIPSAYFIYFQVVVSLSLTDYTEML